MAALAAFLADAVGWPFEDRKRFSAWLCERKTARQSGVLPQPLLVGLIQPTLAEWVGRQTTDPLPLYLLGLFAPWSEEKSSRTARFEAALALDPDFQPARLALVDGILGDVDYSQHHLPDGYIGVPAEDLMLLNRAGVLLKGVTDLAARALRLTELDEYRRQAEHWRTYGCSPPGTAHRSGTVYFES